MGATATSAQILAAQILADKVYTYTAEAIHHLSILYKATSLHST